MSRSQRASIILILSVLAGVLVALTHSAPTAHAAEGPLDLGNHVPLAKPVRLVSRTLSEGETHSFTAIGTGGIPRTGTTGLILTVTAWNAAGEADVSIGPGRPRPWWSSEYVEALTLRSDEDHPVSNTVTMDVDETRTSNHLSVATTGNGAVSVSIDVQGYFTKTEVGGGFVAVRHTTLFDTRADNGAPIPAGGTINKTLTGGIIPAGATGAYMDLAVNGITANGAIIAVPFGTSTVANPVLNFWAGGGTVSNLVSAKLSAGGTVTFKNTSTAPVHLRVRAEGYTTNSPRTGAGWRIEGKYRQVFNVTNASKLDVQIADPGTAGVIVNLQVHATSGSGYLKIYPSGLAPSATSLLTFSDMVGSGDRYRKSGAVLVPGTGGKVTVENSSTAKFQLIIEIQARSYAPTNYATAGGNSAFSVAHTSAGPCYGYLDPTAQNVRVGCASSYDGDPIFALLSPGEKFRGPVSLVTRPGGRIVVTALHAPDGEVWLWEFAHTTGAPIATPIRTFRYMKTTVVAATLSDGTPVGLTSDIEGRYWAINLNATAPNQPTWKALDIPASGPTDDLTSISTSSGIRVFGTTDAGDVVTGLYPSVTATSLAWQSLDTSGAVGRVAAALSKSGDVRVAVFHADNTLWTASVGANGQTIDGWHPANTAYDDLPVEVSGSPTLTYDPQTGLNGVLFRSESVGSGALFKVWENAPNSGRFDGAVSPIFLDTWGIASDVTAWDYRDEVPLVARWSFVYLDTAYGKKGGTSWVAA